MEYKYDDVNYYNGDCGNGDYQGGLPLSQVNFAENDNNYYACAIVLGDIDGWNTDSEVGDYLVNRREAEDYREAGRSGDRDGFKVFAITNSARWYKGGETER